MSEFKSLSNKWLIVLNTVTLTPVIDNGIFLLDKEFEKAGLKAFVTSGLRDEAHQLKIIRDYAIAYGFQRDYSEAMACGLNDKTMYEGKEVFAWQPLWSKLCNIGLIIAPPIDAVALMDYNYFGRNLKGLLCPRSNHIHGFAADIDGGKNGIADETKVITDAGALPYIVSYVPERKNNCLHINFKPTI